MIFFTSFVIEYVAAGLGVIAGVASVAAFIYRRGVSSGLDNACEKRIRDDFADLKDTVIKMEAHGDEIHGKLFDKIDDVKNLLIQHLAVTKG